MRELIRMMKTLDQEVAQCSRCGMCQSVCPLYDVTKNESDVARGKLMLLGGLMRSFFDDPAGVGQRLDQCLLCGSCASNCPRKVNTVEIFLTARTIISGYRRMPLIQKLVFRYVLSNPALFDRISSWGAKRQYLFFKRTGFQLDASCAAMVSPLLSHRHMVPLAPRPFHQISPKLIAKPAANDTVHGLKVAFFVGCLLDKVYPKVAASIAQILNYHNVRVIIPSTQGCCGIPALSAGDDVTFNRLVGHNLKQFDPSEFDYLVTGCATCTATIKKIWPSMVKLASAADQKTAIDRISEKTYDIHQFLVDVIGVKPSEMSTEKTSGPVITYHDPCHLRKTLGVYSEPRYLIQASDAYVYAEMPDASACCGMGGSFNLKHYDLSAEIGKKKVANIESTDAAAVATGCPACMIHLSDMFALQKKKIRVVHSVEIYFEKILSTDTS